MFFKALRCYAYPGTLTYSAEYLDTLLREQAWRAPGSIELSTAGFVPPFPDEDGPLVEMIDGVPLIALKITTKAVPGPVVSEALKKRVAEIEQQEGRKVYSKERKQLREECFMQLLPQAFPRHKIVRAYLADHIYLDNAAPSPCEQLLTSLRAALGSLQCVPLQPEAPHLLTQFVRGQVEAPLLSLGSAAKLVEPHENASIQLTEVDLRSAEVDALIEEGYGVEAVALSLREDPDGDFLLHAKVDYGFAFRGIKFTDLCSDRADADAGANDDAEAQAHAWATASALINLQSMRALVEATGAALGGLPEPEPAF